MTGRGRGRPPKSSPSPTPPTAASGQSASAQGADANAQQRASAGAMMGIPSFTSDILNQLPPPKQSEMIALVNRFKSKQISIQEFLGVAKTLLGDRLYALLAQGMSSAVRMPGGMLGLASMPPAMQPQLPMMRPATVLHSVPQMFSHAHQGLVQPTPQQYQQQLQHQQQLLQQQQQNGEELNDATKIDSASLQDVIQYSGIDLRAEAEMIESELHMPGAGYALAAGPAAQDVRMRPDYFFNAPRMKAIVFLAAKQRGIASVTDEVFELVALALQRRMLNILTGVAEISRHRVDAGRASFKIKVENDPKKQLWLLERVYEEQLAKQNRSLLQGQLPKAGEPQDRARAKKTPAAEKKASGEDVIVKTRLANTTAMAAVGLQQKAWMTAGIVGLQQQAAAAKPADATDSAESEAAAMEAVRIPLHFSQAPSVTPVTDRDLHVQVSQRTVTLKDLVFFCERDPQLARSMLMLTLYNLSNF